MSLLPLLPSHPTCVACDLSALGCRSPGLPAVAYPSLPLSPTTPILYVVGSHPSSVDDRRGQAHVSPSSQMMKAVFLDALSLPAVASIFLSNALRCSPPVVGDFTPKPRQLKACHPHLLADLSFLSGSFSPPIHLLLLGSAATQQVLGCTVTTAINSRQGCAIDLAGRRVRCFSTYHPAALAARRSPSLVHACISHLTLLKRSLLGEESSTPTVRLSPPRGPTPDDPRLISLDTETFGACSHDDHGRPLPPQSVFHPARCLHTDGVDPSSLVLCASVTVCSGSPTSPNPSLTMVFQLGKPLHRLLLRKWLAHSTTILGINLPFDVLMLRAFGYSDVLFPTGVPPCPLPSTPTSAPHSTISSSPSKSASPLSKSDGPTSTLPPNPTPKPSLPPMLASEMATAPATSSHTLIDLSVVNYLESEMRPERSLKNLGPILGTHSYSRLRTLKDGYRFPSPSDPSLHRYCAADTIFTVASIAELWRRIPDGSAKKSPASIAAYSDALWLSIAMSENGIPFSIPGLRLREAECERIIASTEAAALTDHSLLLSGKGSQKSQEEFFNLCLLAAPAALSSPLLRRTPKTKKLSFDDDNRRLVAEHLPPNHPLHGPLALVASHSDARKTLSSFITPLLHHRANHPDDQRSVLLPTPLPEVGIAYPSWLVCPSHVKDGGGDSGGTIQSRMTAKGPALQTYPPSLRSLIVSRYPGGRIVWVDLNQAELRMAAVIFGDPVLIRDFSEGRDGHSDLAVEIWGNSITSDPAFKDKYRQPAKHARFTALNYGGPEVLQVTIRHKAKMDISLAECQRILQGHDRKYHVLRSAQAALVDRVVLDHRLEMPIIGESRFFRGSPSTVRATYSATIVNFRIQSAAANVQKDIQARLLHTLPPLVLQCANVYDAVVLDVPPSISNAALHPVIQEAVDHTSTSGFYSLLCAHHSRTVPLAFELQEKS